MVDDIYNDSLKRMDKSREAFKSTLAKIRAGRAHPSLLEQVQVNYYDNLVPINQVASINAEDARTLKITPWEKEIVAEIERAIISANLGLNPSSAGQVIRVPLPPLTEERRQNLIKLVREETEKAKVAVRNIRRDANSDFKTLLKEKEISEDETHVAEDHIQKITDVYIEDINNILAEKEKSLLEV